VPIYTNIFVAERLLQAEHGRPEYSSAGLDEIYKKKESTKANKRKRITRRKSRRETPLFKS
jgi:hypothetical protein